MPSRSFEHADTPRFDGHERALLLPFGRDSYLPAIVEAAGGVALPMDEATDRLVYELEGAPQPTTLVYSGMGGPAAANALEMLAANGAKSVVVFGACGGVDPAVGIGELVVATGGVRGEGVSGYYAPAGYPALCAPDITAALWERARASGVAAHRGVVFTTDAGYRQGAEVYEDCAGLVIAVECECASAAVVGARLGLAVGCLCFCTDNVVLERSQDHTYRGLRDPRVANGFRRGLEAALTALAGTAPGTSA